MASLKSRFPNYSISEIYEKYPKWIVAELIHKEYGDLLNNAVIVGLRTQDEVEYLKKHYEVKLIALTSSLHTCFVRSIDRPHREHYESEEVFYQKRILADEALGLQVVCAQAEELICNDGISKEVYLNLAYQRIMKHLNRS